MNLIPSGEWGGCVQGGVATFGCTKIVFQNVFTAFLLFAGIVALFFIIFAGIKLIVSGGNKEKLIGASGTLVFAIAGLFVVIFSCFIVVQVSNITGVPLQCGLPSFPFKPTVPTASQSPPALQTENQPASTCTDDKEWFTPVPISQISEPIYRSADAAELVKVLVEPRWVPLLVGAADTDYLYKSTRWPVEPYFGITVYFARFSSRSRLAEFFRVREEITTKFAKFLEQRGLDPGSKDMKVGWVECPNGIYAYASQYTPLIYLYSPKEISVSVKVSSPLISPKIVYNNSWQVVVFPDGTITTQDGEKHRFIPYEFLRNDFRRPEKGFVIEDSKLEQYLIHDFWPKLGLTNQEIEDYWQDTKPRVKPSPYYFISLIDRSEVDRVLPMEVSPKPDTIIRNMTYILPLSRSPSISIMPLEEGKLRAPERKGFTVLENGVFTDGF